jgi:hypothetical protein
MIVFLLNPNQQLIINNFQKAFIKKIHNYSSFVIKNYQNAIPFDSENNDNLKQIATSINKFTIFEPKIKTFSNDFTNSFYNLKTSNFSHCLVCTIQIEQNNKNIIFDFPLAFYKIKDRCSQTIQNNIISELNKIGTNIFPMQIKVFRIGNCLCQNNSFVLEDSVWKKLK